MQSRQKLIANSIHYMIAIQRFNTLFFRPFGSIRTDVAADDSPTSENTIRHGTCQSSGSSNVRP